MLVVTVGFACIAGLSVVTDIALVKALPSLHDEHGGTESVPVLLLTLAYVALYTTGGGYAAARLSRSHAVRHAIAVGVCVMGFLAAGSVTRWELAPAWYHAASVALALPCAWLGGQWRVRELAESSRSRLSRAQVV